MPRSRTRHARVGPHRDDDQVVEVGPATRSSRGPCVRTPHAARLVRSRAGRRGAPGSAAGRPMPDLAGSPEPCAARRLVDRRTHDLDRRLRLAAEQDRLADARERLDVLRLELPAQSASASSVTLAQAPAAGDRDPGEDRAPRRASNFSMTGPRPICLCRAGTGSWRPSPDVLGGRLDVEDERDSETTSSGPRWSSS